MILPEIHNWLESRTGVPYDFSDEFNKIRGDVIFNNPDSWRLAVSMIVYSANECLDEIDNNKYDIPDDLPSAMEMKKIISESVLESFRIILEYICRTLNMTQPTINSYDSLTLYTSTLYELVSLLTQNDIDTIMSKDLYNKHEKAYDHTFANVLSVESSDLSNMSYIINSIIMTDDEEYE